MANNPQGTPGTIFANGLGRSIWIVQKIFGLAPLLSNRRATLIKADGKDILSVRMHLNSEKEAQQDAEIFTSEIGEENLSV